MRSRELRVAIVYDCLFPLTHGGGERVYREIAERLVARGARVDYLTRQQWSAGDPPAAPFDVIGVPTGEIYSSTGTRTFRGALAFALAVFRVLVRRRSHYDMVIASALPVLTLLAARAALLGSRTTVVADWLEIWGGAQWRAYSGALGGTVAHALQTVGIWCTGIHTVNSVFTRDRLLARRTGARVITLGLVDLAGPPGAGVARAQPPRIMVVGRLISEKSVADVVRSMPAVLRVHPTAELHIVGRGPEEDALAALIGDLGLTTSARLLGALPDDDLVDAMRSAAVHVSASRREGFGLVVAEAARWGVPSVVVDHADSAAVALIQEGENGFVSADPDPESIGGAISRAISAGDSLRETTRRWYERVSSSEGLDRSIDRLLEVAGLGDDPGEDRRRERSGAVPGEQGGSRAPLV